MLQEPEVQEGVAGYGVTQSDTGQYLGPRSGSTALVALVRDSGLVVASVGDSRSAPLT